MKIRVVITGIGMLTPLGTAGETWDSLIRSESGIGPITRFDASSFPSRIAGEVKSFDPLHFVTAGEAHKTDPFIQYAVAAALMALQDSGLGSVPATRTGVLVGSSRGGVSTAERNMAALIAKGPRAVSPFYIPMSLVNMASGFIAMKTGAKGPCLDVSTACATGTHAIGEAMKIIQRGDADVMIAGGSEASLTPLVLAGFCQARALSRLNAEPDRASKPFDKNRDGFVLAEGAAVIILEELTHAERRNARIYAEVSGYGLTCDAYHYARPDENGEGSSRAMQLALQDACLHPGEIGYLNAHGTSTRPNDRIETAAIKLAFGNHAFSVPISSPKSMLGHMLGAAGAAEAAITGLALHHGILPPTANRENPDPECDLDYIPDGARKTTAAAALSNSLGFGGINAALVLKRYFPLV